MYRLIHKSKYWFILSGLLTILSIVFIIIFGLNLGIDYKGGTVIQFSSENQNAKNLTEQVLKDKSITNYQLKDGGINEYNLKLPVLTNKEHNSLTESLRASLGDYTETKYDSIGPTISKDLTNKSIWAIVLASFGIILYIAYAFRHIPRPLSPWKFGLSAIIALIHDLFITIGFVALIGHFFSWMEVDALFMTAMLTILGFSVHDTIVVYDRLRENFIKNPHQNIELTAEESINQTITRSINTSLTVVIVLLTLFLLGGSSIKHFVLILLFGVVIGTYSSIFVATPILVKWHSRNNPNRNG